MGSLKDDLCILNDFPEQQSNYKFSSLTEGSFGGVIIIPFELYRIFLSAMLRKLR